MPKSRLEFWRPKLEGNRIRDLENQSKLDEMGWRYLIIWECEIKDRQELSGRLDDFLSNNLTERARA